MFDDLKKETSDATINMKDDEARASEEHIVKPVFQCSIHADYR